MTWIIVYLRYRQQNEEMRNEDHTCRKFLLLTVNIIKINFVPLNYLSIYYSKSIKKNLIVRKYKHFLLSCSYLNFIQQSHVYSKMIQLCYTLRRK